MSVDHAGGTPKLITRATVDFGNDTLDVTTTMIKGHELDLTNPPVSQQSIKVRRNSIRRSSTLQFLASPKEPEPNEQPIKSMVHIPSISTPAIQPTISSSTPETPEKQPILKPGHIRQKS